MSTPSNCDLQEIQYIIYPRLLTLLVCYLLVVTVSQDTGRGTRSSAVSQDTGYGG